MTIFTDDRDRHEFLDLLADVFESHNVDCLAFCLMANHYHLVITTNEANLSRAMKRLNSPFAMHWNFDRARPGHVFQGRFGAQVIQDETYLLVVSRYVVRNPVRAGVVTSPEQWPWSSYGATAGIVRAPPFLRPEMIWHQFGGMDLETSCRRYREFVAASAEPQPLPYDAILGDETFVQRFKEQCASANSEVPKRQRRSATPLGSFLSDAVTTAGRVAGATAAHAAGYSLKEIGSFLGVHYSTVSKMIPRAARRPGHLPAGSGKSRCGPYSVGRSVGSGI